MSTHTDVYIVVTRVGDNREEMELLDRPPLWIAQPGQYLRIASINGGDSRAIAWPTKRQSLARDIVDALLDPHLEPEHKHSAMLEVDLLLEKWRIGEWWT